MATKQQLMKCANCGLANVCRNPARFNGGCDIDGADDFGCGFLDDEYDYGDEDLYEDDEDLYEH